MTTKNIILSIGALGLSGVMCRAQDKPHMLIYLADDHGCMQSGPYGDAFVRTPYMSQVAAEGLTFDNAFVASPASGPSRAALLSGMMSARNGAIANHQLPHTQTQTMVHCLQEQGYEVVALGKIAHGKQHTEMSGFDVWKYDVHRRQIVEQVEAYLKQRTSSKPLCLMVGDNRPHVPWIKHAVYNPAEVELPPYLIDTPETRALWVRYLTDVTGLDATMAEVNRLFADYVGGSDYLFVYSADHGAQWPFGKWNLYDLGTRTSLLFRWPGHIPAGVRTNAMVSWVDLMPTLIDCAGGHVSDGIDGRSFARVLRRPTASHRKEIYTTHTGDGIMNVYPIRAIRTARYKYIRNLRPDCYHSNHSDILRKPDAGAYWNSWEEKAKNDSQARQLINRYYVRPAEELYDVINDPLEQHNLATLPAYRTQMGKLARKLDKWMQQQGDKQLIYENPYPVTGPLPSQIVGRK